MRYFLIPFTLLISLLHCCQQEEKVEPIIEEEIIIDEHNSPPNLFKVYIDRVMYNYADISWDKTTDPENDIIYYDVYLGQIKQKENISNIFNFRFENLNPETIYQGNVCAIDSKGDSIAIPFSFETTKYFASFDRLIMIQDEQPGPLSLESCIDGGYMIGGTINFGNSQDLIAIKTDSLGKVEWYSIYKYDLEADIAQIKQTSDQGYVFVTRKRILKLDSFGELIWEYTKSEDLHVGLLGYRSVIESTSNDFFVTGSVQNWSTNTKIASITKFNSDGELQWEKYYEKNKWNEGCFIEMSGNSNFVILGSTGNESEDLFVLKIDQQGEILIEKIFDDPDYDFAKQIKPTFDGGFIIGGYSWGDRNISSIRTIKLDNNCEIIWDNKFRWGSFQDVLYGITQVNDGGFVFTGVSRSSAVYDIKCILAKIDNNGELVWNKFLTPDYSDYIWSGIDIQSTNDNGIVLTGAKGSVWNQSVEKEYGLWILRTNEFGEYYE